MGHDAGWLCDRRTFVKWAGVVAGSAVVGALGGCVADEAVTPADDGAADEVVPARASESATDAATDAASRQEAPQPETETEEAPMSETATAAVVYFSVTGNTEAAAEKIAAACGATPQAIEPAEPYSAADIDYNSDCRANVEQQDDLSIRPALAEPTPDVAGASTVFLGYPIWWGKVPRVVLTYVESGALAGKTVIPFCTSGSTGIAGSLSELEAADPSVNWQDGRRFESSVPETDIEAFVAPYAG